MHSTAPATVQGLTRFLTHFYSDVLPWSLLDGSRRRASHTVRSMGPHDDVATRMVVAVTPLPILATEMEAPCAQS